MPPCYVFAPYASGAEARQSEKQQREKFGVESGVEKAAGAVEVGADLIDGRIEPAAVHGFHAGEPVKVGDNQHDTDCPQEVHDLCQRSEVVLLLAHNNVELKIKISGDALSSSFAAYGGGILPRRD